MPDFTVLYTAPSRPLSHHWERSVGSGRAALALRADWQRQLAFAHHACGFERVRFHGILCDELGTHRAIEGRPTDSFFNADQIYDHVLAIGMAPIVELSFMPTALASGDTTVFDYHANVTPPKDVRQWAGLVGRIVAHWRSRYGARALGDWLFEVWNEPDEIGFWPSTRERYFDLYAATARAIKEVDAALRVAGPVTSKCAWLPEFQAFLAQSGAPCDVISTHIYPTDAVGGSGTDTMTQLARSGRSFLRDALSRARRDAAGKPLWLTEWSVTSNPRDPLHDQAYAAAYLTKSVFDLDGLVDASSWWTFSDIFAENAFPAAPFHGGFGLLTIHGVPKPSFRAFELLHRVGDDLVAVDGRHETVELWAVRRGRRLHVVIVNLALPGEAIADEVVRVRVADCPPPARARVERIDDDHANPRRLWLDWSEPRALDPRQVDALMAASAVVPETIACERDGDGFRFALTAPSNAVAFVTLDFDDADPPETDRYPAIDDPVAGSIGGIVGGAVPGTAAPDAGGARPGGPRPRGESLLDELQRDALSYFVWRANPANGLVADASREGSPASIGATGLALACYPVAVERGWMARSAALERTLTTLRFLAGASQAGRPDATGWRGFYFHFLDLAHGRRVWDSEISTIDTALLVAGALLAAEYFRGDGVDERAVRDLAAELHGRVEWRAALADDGAITHGWQPYQGRLPYRWTGYSEGLLLYAIALGAPAPPPRSAYLAATRDYLWREFYGLEYLYAAPLFIHQLPQCWIDPRGIRDGWMRARPGGGIDLFENGRRATLAQSRYAADNPYGFLGYAADCFGFTACEGPGPATLEIEGRRRKFFGYEARGAPGGPDDGTIAPWGTLASLPYAPEEVARCIRRFHDLKLRERTVHGFKTTFNPTFANSLDAPWMSEYHYGLNQGPIVLMIENHRTGLPWALMRGCAPLMRGLKRCGFAGGWLGEEGLGARG